MDTKSILRFLTPPISLTCTLFYELVKVLRFTQLLKPAIVSSRCYNATIPRVSLRAISIMNINREDTIASFSC